MRHLNKGCQDSRDFVRSKRPMACPNPAFIKQLEVWEKCKFDLQNRSIVDQGPDPDPENLGCMTEGNLGSTGGGEEVEQEAKCIRKVEEHEKREYRTGAEAKIEVSHHRATNPPTKLLSVPKVTAGHSTERQDFDNHSATNEVSCHGVDTATSAPVPAPETVRAAIMSLCLKYPAMGKKKLLRILNAEQGWSIGSKDFRSHLEAISG